MIPFLVAAGVSPGVRGTTLTLSAGDGGISEETDRGRGRFDL